MALLYFHLVTCHVDVINADLDAVPFPLSKEDLGLHFYRDPSFAFANVDHDFPVLK
ncbi:hypothetical protein D9757_011007 [Collybiopsis confluens]|uniref:Uncharacterized protein n=1 Tax=Collybiopsis confluens TaxID=2823264 RepID=A0A8H5GDH7_9AGAR|nr:hypothetical protein D9757_011007 [Collybiopsis confluens]